MPVVKLSLTDKYYQKLKNMADAEFMSIQDYIRSKIFQERTIFEPEEAYMVRNGLLKQVLLEFLADALTSILNPLIQASNM